MIKIIGDGAIGTYISYLLSRGGIENAIKGIIPKRDHLVKVGGLIEDSFYISYFNGYDEVVKDDIIILAVKSYDLPNLFIQLLENSFNENQIILIQNGLNLMKGFENSFNRLDQVIVTAGVTTKSKDEIAYNGGDLYYSSSLNSRVSTLFDKANFLPTDNIELLIYDKFIINCVINPLTTILGSSNRSILDPNIDCLVEKLFGEITRTFDQLGINYSITLDRVKEIASFDNSSSMLQDYRLGNRSELDYLNRYLLQLGKKNNLDLPINFTIVSLVDTIFSLRG